MVLLLLTLLTPLSALAQQFGPYGLPVDVAAGSDGAGKVKTWLDWNNGDGSATFTATNAAGNVVSQNTFGPYNDSSGTFTTPRISGCPNGQAEVMWRRSDGALSLWRLSADGKTPNGHSYGPYIDPQGTWSPQDISVGPDNKTRVLWVRPDGYFTVWTVDDSTGNFTQMLAGPYANWTPKTIAVGPDNFTHLLWNNTNGSALLWTIDLNGNFTTNNNGVAYGPYSGYTAIDISMGSDNNAHLLWRQTDGTTISVWTVSPNGTWSNDNSYTFGPVSGFAATTVGESPFSDSDNLTRFLWGAPNDAFVLSLNATSAASGWTGSQKSYVEAFSVPPIIKVFGGMNATAQVVLPAPSPPGGITLSLSSDNTTYAQIPAPATATIPAGATSTTFAATTSPNRTQNTVFVKIIASEGAVRNSGTGLVGIFPPPGATVGNQYVVPTVTSSYGFVTPVYSVPVLVNFPVQPGEAYSDVDVRAYSGPPQTQYLQVYANGSLTPGTHSFTVIGSAPPNYDHTDYGGTVQVVQNNGTAAIQNSGFENNGVGYSEAAYKPLNDLWTYTDHDLYYLNGSGVTGAQSSFASGLLLPEGIGGSSPITYHAAFLQGASQISQTILLGQDIGNSQGVLSFYASQFAGQSSSQSLDVSIDGVLLATVTPYGYNNGFYEQYPYRVQIPFPLTRGSHLLKFESTVPNVSNPNNGNLIDNVGLIY